MKFIKDILLFDVEATTEDPDTGNMLQLAAVLLDKDNLLEKATFNSYIRVSLIDSTITQHAKLLGVSFEAIRKSPKIYDCIKEFSKHFPDAPLLASQTIKQVFFLKNAYKKAAIPFPFSYHVLNLWTLQYLTTQRQGLQKSPSLHTMLEHYKLKERNPKNAFERVRLEAEVLRRILK